MNIQQGKPSGRTTKFWVIEVTSKVKGRREMTSIISKLYPATQKAKATDRADEINNKYGKSYQDPNASWSKHPIQYKTATIKKIGITDDRKVYSV